MSAELNIAALKLALSYDPDTGEFRWLTSRGGLVAGSKAGSVVPFHEGRCHYLVIGFDGRKHMATKLAWVLMTGCLPDHFIDHRNGNSLDNRWDNLRLATPRQNAQNSRIRADNSSGHKGVSWCAQTNKWVARIREPNGKYLNLGRFQTVHEARDAYEKTAAQLFGEFKRAA